MLQDSFRILAPKVKAFLRYLLIVTAAIDLLTGQEQPLDDWSLQGPFPTLRSLDSLTSGDGIVVIDFWNEEGEALVKEGDGAFALESLGLPEVSRVSGVRYRNGTWLAIQSGQVFVKESWQGPWMRTGPSDLEFAQSFSTENYFWLSTSGEYTRFFSSDAGSTSVIFDPKTELLGKSFRSRKIRRFLFRLAISRRGPVTL